MSEFQVGRSYEGQYPASNYEHVKLRLETRRFRVDAIHEGKVKDVTWKANPYVRRLGRRLDVYDYEARKAKTFYEGALTDAREIEPPVELVGWQVVAKGNGHASVVMACTDSQVTAHAAVETYNWGSKYTGRTAEVVSFPLPILVCNPLRKAE